MGDKGQEGVKDLKKCVTPFMDSPLTTILRNNLYKYFKSVIA